MEAAKAAELQGIEAFERFHTLIFPSHFEEHLDISDEAVLASLARRAGLDVDKLLSDLRRGTFRQKVMEEYEEALRDYGGWGVPLAIIAGEIPLAGAVPIDMYHRAVEVILASRSKAIETK